MSMARIDAHDRQIDPPELVPEPARHRPSLEADPFRPRCIFAQHACQCTRIRLRLFLRTSTTNNEETSRPTFCFMIALQIIRLR